MSRRPRAARSLAWPRKLVYGLLTTIAVFLIAEVLLRLVVSDENTDPWIGFESHAPLYVERQVDGLPMMQTADSKLEYFNAQTFPKRKPPATVRVFCVGGSTTYGRPYDDTTSYVRWLRELTETVDARRQWEVINAGGISYASYRIAAVVEELGHYAPDLVIVHTGHNEFLEERTYRDQNEHPSLVRRSTEWLQGSRIFGLLHAAWHGPTGSRPAWVFPAEVNAILDHTTGPTSYQRDETLRKEIIANFQSNLRKIVTTARAGGAKVILISPAANEKDFSPFKSEFARQLSASMEEKWILAFTQGQKLRASGEFEQALAAFDTAAGIDAGRADLHYERGQTLFAMDRYDEASREFTQAIDQDICPLRALPEIHHLVEQTALQLKVPLIDFDSIVKQDCLRTFGHACPGNDYFVDHVHPTVETHRLLSLALLEGLRQIGFLEFESPQREAALAAVSRTVEQSINPELQARALTNLAQVLSWAGKQAEAGPIAAQAVQLRASHGLPEEPESLFYLAVHLQTLGESERATSLLEKVVKYAPEDVQSRSRLARLLYDQRRYEEARALIVEALQLAPNDYSLNHLLESLPSQVSQPEDL